MFLWKLLPVWFLPLAQAQPSVKVPLYIGSMAPLTGKRAWWGAGITAAMQMAFDYINNSSDILPSYELRLLANDTKVRIILITSPTFHLTEGSITRELQDLRSDRTNFEPTQTCCMVYMSHCVAMNGWLWASANVAVWYIHVALCHTVSVEIHMNVVPRSTGDTNSETEN